MKFLLVIITTMICQFYHAQVADFMASPKTSCIAPITVFFTDQSTIPDTWAWNFGDGGTSTAQNPIHTYTTPGIFIVKLTIQDTNTGVSSIKFDTIRLSQLNAIISDPSHFNCAPVTANFIDGSTSNQGIQSWLWNFGDGNSSSLQNPTHVYPTPGTYDVSLTVTDSIGCTSIQTKTNHVQAIGPNVNFSASQTTICPNTLVNFTDLSTFGSPVTGWSWNFGDGSPTSNLQNPSHTYLTPSFHTVSLTINDLDGCSRTFTQTDYIDARDLIDPLISCPSNVSMSSDAGQCFSTAAIGTATATDNCGVPIITNDAPANFPIGTTTVTWTATDVGGNVVSCTQLVTVTDDESPTITCPATIILPTDIGQCTSTATFGTATGTDNCGVPTITHDSPANFPIGNTTVTWTSTDGSGNFVTCTQTVTVEDIENPTISCPAPIIINTDFGQCTATAAIGAATGTDNCGIPAIANDAPANFPIGNTTVTWTSTDAAGNFVTCTQLVTVEDNENPTLVCPVAITMNTDPGQCTSSASIGVATGTDNCGTPIITNDAPANFPIGTTTIIWTATDAAGNFVTCTQIVTIEDNENPTVICPTDIITYGDVNCNFVLSDYTSLAVSADNCTATPIITQSPISGTTITGSGNHTITLTTTDTAGNTAICSFEVVIVDTIAPSVNCLTNQTAVLDQNCEFVLPDYGLMTNLSDNCDANISITQTPAPGIVYSGIQNLPITINFEDASGNLSSCSFIVDVKTNELNPGCLEDLVIATLLTPNGDGRNDTWIIREPDFIEDCTVQVFNRWGQKVFESTNYQNDWEGDFNGVKLSDGSYYYIILCNDEISYSGPLTLLNASN